MAVKKTVKKTVRSSDRSNVRNNQEEDLKKRKTRLKLGDEQSDVAYESAASDESFYRLKYTETDNVFGLVHPDFVAVAEHYIKIGDETRRLVCPVQDTGDLDRILNKWGFSEGCDMCARKKQLFEEAPKDSKDVIDIKKRKIAYDMASKTAYYLYAFKGDADTRRQRGKKVVTPYFDKIIIKKLQLTKDAFTKFFNAFKEAGLNQEDVYGLPVNFICGKGTGAYNEVQQVEFYPRHIVKNIPQIPIDFSGVETVDYDSIVKVIKDWDAHLPAMLSGIESKQRSKGTKSKAVRKKSTRK